MASKEDAEFVAGAVDEILLHKEWINYIAIMPHLYEDFYVLVGVKEDFDLVKAAEDACLPMELLLDCKVVFSHMKKDYMLATQTTNLETHREGRRGG